MFKSILVPLDGSPLAERALPYAVAVARAHRGRLALVRAALDHTFPGTDPTEKQTAVMREAEAYLEQMAGRIAARDLPIDTGVSYGGAVEGILLEADIRHADLILIATHGRSGLGRWVYGSIAEAVLARATVPVLLVRAWDQPPGAAPFGDQPRILVPLDGSPFAEEALPAALSMARALKGRLVLLHAVSPAETTALPEQGLLGVQATAAEREAAAHQYLVGLLGSLAGERVQAQPVVRAGLPAGAIAEVVREYGVTLVAMATHGRTGLPRLVMGSVADTVLRRSNLPLLLVRPQAIAEAGVPARVAAL